MNQNNDVRNDSNSEVAQIYRKYKTIGRGYKEIDPEIRDVIKSLHIVTEFLNTRCAYTQKISAQTNDLHGLNRDLEIFVKVQDDHHDDGLFFKGFEYAHQEIRERNRKESQS